MNIPASDKVHFSGCLVKKSRIVFVISFIASFINNLPSPELLHYDRLKTFGTKTIYDYAIVESMLNYYTFESMQSLWNFLCRRFHEISLESIAARGFFSLAFPCDNIPKGLYEELSKKKEFQWNKTRLFQVDENFVKKSHPDNNFSSIKKNLIDHVSIRPRNTFPIDVRSASPADSAIKYSASILESFDLKEGNFPDIDLIFLGLGSDGRIASILPGSETVEERKKIAVPVHNEDGKPDRITLTLPVLNNAKNIIFIILGKEKAKAVSKLIKDRNLSLPASLVNPSNKPPEILLDEGASSLL